MTEAVWSEQERMFTRIAELAAEYRNVYGADRGLETMAEQLCHLADDEALYAKGWTGLVCFLMRASG
ncbi:hypothetical protein [Sphingobium indicum]